jgi:hypothetical protein
LREIREINERVRADLDRQSAAEHQALQREKAEKMEQRFKEKTGQMHHLVSTKHIPGVFSPTRDKMGRVVVQNHHLEDHLRMNAAKKFPT